MAFPRPEASFSSFVPSCEIIFLSGIERVLQLLHRPLTLIQPTKGADDFQRRPNSVKGAMVRISVSSMWAMPSSAYLSREAYCLPRALTAFNIAGDRAVCQRPGQQQRHFKSIGRLPGEGIPSAAISQLPNTVRIVATYFLRRLELGQALKGVYGKPDGGATKSAGMVAFPCRRWPFMDKTQGCLVREMAF